MGSKSKHHAEKKMWHISNQMPFIKYSKLHHGFKSVPRKKDTFKKPYFDFVLTPFVERAEAVQPPKCSNLEQITLEMGEPELSVTKLIYFYLYSSSTYDKFKT